MHSMSASRRFTAILLAKEVSETGECAVAAVCGWRRMISVNKAVHASADVCQFVGLML